MVKDDNLMRRLKALGFALFENEEPVDANLALADVVRTRDLRLWEGFPVVLANSAEKGMFDYDKARRFLTSSTRGHLESLVSVSLALYKVLDVDFPWAKALFEALNSREKKEFKVFFSLLKKGVDFEVGGQHISSQRLKTNFKNYFGKTSSGVGELLNARDELGLEYALSQLLSPKQKDLFLKKLKGEKLTKTEREYFSCLVKKKVLALANTELHRLAQKLLE